MAYIISIVITGVWLLFTLYPLLSTIKQRERFTKQLIIAASGYYLLNQLKLEQSLAFLIQHLHQNLMLLEGIGWRYGQTKQKVADKLGEASLVLVSGCWLIALLQEYSLYVPMGVAVAVILVQLYQGTLKRVKQRRQSITLELPILLTKMTLLIEAGETIPAAFVRCMGQLQHSRHPLHHEWNIAITMLKNGESFHIVIDKFSKRCSVQHVSILCTYLLLNMTRGGSYFVTSIQDLMDELWEQRKTIARKKGEEASSKLVFPNIFILLMLMILILAPALSMIGGI